MRFSKLVIITFAFTLLTSLGQNVVAQCDDWGFAMGQDGLYIEGMDRDIYGNYYLAGQYIGSVPATIGTSQFQPRGDRTSFIAKLDKNRNTQWLKVLPEGENILSSMIKVDRQGNVILTGVFSSPTLTIDCISINNTSSRFDTFIAKIDTQGSALWMTNPNGFNDEQAIALNIDQNNNIIITGSFVSGHIQFDGIRVNNSGSGYDTYLAKYNPNGQAVWAKAFGSDVLYDYPRDVATDMAGNVYLTGWFGSAGMDFDGIFVAQKTISTNYYLVKFNSGGQAQWARETFGNAFARGQGVTTDEDGNIYTVGGFSDGAIFDMDPVTINGDDDGFLAKYDHNGNVSWVRNIGGDRFELSTAVANYGNRIRTATYFYSNTMTLPSEVINKPTFASDVLIAEFDNNGDYICHSRTSGDGEDAAYHLRIDSLGNTLMPVESILGGTTSFGNQISFTDQFATFAAQLGQSNDFLQDSRRPNEFEISIGSDVELCQGETILLSAGVSCAEYLWQDGSTDAEFMVTEPGLYWIQVTRNAQIERDTIEVNYTTALTVDLGENLAICEGESITLSTFQEGAYYLWSDSSTNEQIVVSEAGLYWVSLSNSCETITDSITVSVSPRLSLDLGQDTAVCSDQVITLDAGDQEAEFLWQDGSTDRFFTAEESGLYVVTVTSQCESLTDSIHISYPALADINIPNVITPNNDGFNDALVIDDQLVGSRISIVNRWGKQVYQSNAYENDWQAENLPTGTYYYQIEAKCVDQGLNGWIQVVR